LEQSETAEEAMTNLRSAAGSVITLVEITTREGLEYFRQRALFNGSVVVPILLKEYEALPPAIKAQLTLKKPLSYSDALSKIMELEEAVGGDRIHYEDSFARLSNDKYWESVKSDLKEFCLNSDFKNYLLLVTALSNDMHIDDSVKEEWRFLLLEAFKFYKMPERRADAMVNHVRVAVASAIGFLKKAMKRLGVYEDIITGIKKIFLEEDFVFIDTEGNELPSPSSSAQGSNKTCC